MSEATYKFLRTVGGITYFTSVSVHADICHGQTEAVADLGTPDDSAGEISAATEPTWVGAAIAGARLALEYLRSKGRIDNGCRIRITRIVGSVLDTRDDVVECAALIATLMAVDDSLASLKPTFDGSHWQVPLA